MNRSELKQLIREVIEELSQTRSVKGYAIVNSAKLLNNPLLDTEQEIRVEAEGTEAGDPIVYALEDTYAQDSEGNNTEVLLFKKDQQIKLDQISPKSLQNLIDAIDHSFSQL